MPEYFDPFSDSDQPTEDLDFFDPFAEDTWGDVAGAVAENAPQAFKRQLGGAMQAVGNANPLANSTVGMFFTPENDPAMADIISTQRERANAPGGISDIGKTLFDEATAEIQANHPNIDPESAKGYAYDLSMALVNMGPALAGSITSRNPNVGMTVLGSQIYGGRYGESIAIGRTPEEAHSDAVFYATAEAIPERIPLGILMRPGKKFAHRVMQSAGAEGVQEMLTEALQSGYDAGILNEDMTFGEALNNIKRAGIIGAGMGGSMATITHPFARNEADQKRGNDEFSDMYARAREEAPLEPIGKREESALKQPELSEADKASPIPNDLIQEGRSVMDDGEATSKANRILRSADLPKVSTPVTVQVDGITATGVIADAFETENGPGVKVLLEDGSIFSPTIEDLQNRRASITAGHTQAVDVEPVQNEPEILEAPHLPQERQETVSASPLAKIPEMAPQRADLPPSRSNLGAAEQTRNIIEGNEAISAPIVTDELTHLEESEVSPQPLVTEETGTVEQTETFDPFSQLPPTAVLSGEKPIQQLAPMYDAATPVEPVWQETVDQERLVEEVLAIAQTIAPKANAKVVNELFGVLPKRGLIRVNGAYRPAQNLIEVAMSPDNPKVTVRHEGIHALKSMGLFTKTEWNLMANRARREWIGTHNIERPYSGLSKDQKIEEAIASAFATYANGNGKYPPTIRRIMEKIRQFLERLRNTLHGQGFQTVEDIFDAVESGAVGNRPTPPTEEVSGLEPAPAYASEAVGDKFSVAETETAPLTKQERLKAKAKSFKFDDAETEKRWAEARKGREDPKAAVQRSKEWLEHIVHGFTRHHIHLPNAPEFAKAHETLRKVEAAPQAAKEEAVRILRDITDGMTARDLDLFTRKVVLDDLVHEAEQGHDLPFGLTAETLPQEKVKVDAAVLAWPKMREALRKRNQFVSKISRGLVEAGILKKEQLTNPAYFHHQVLNYARAQQSFIGTTQKLRKPRPGYAKGRKGSMHDINANYLEAKFEWLHRAMIDISTAKALESIQQDYDKHETAKGVAEETNNLAVAELIKSGEAKTEADARKLLHSRKKWAELENFIPEGYVLWQPDRGNVFFTAKTLPERAVDHLMDAMTHENIPGVSQRELELAIGQMREVLVIGGPKYQMVLPEELAETLDGLRNDATTGLFDHIIATPLAWWKRWVLINPRRVLKYNINNLSGDLDAVIAGNPKAIKKMPLAIRELWDVMHGKVPSQRYRDAVERGVFDSALSAQEIPDINLMSEFEQVITHPRLKEPHRFALSGLMKVWRALQRYTGFRENWLRYAAYIDYVERLERGETMKSIGYGAASPQMVDAIKDKKDRAALLARELVGDYGNVSAFGQSLRNRVIPFYSWMEINTKRYVRLIGNAYGQGVGQAAKVGAITGAGISARLGLRMATMYALVSIWNNLFFPAEEDELSDEERVRLHLNLGRDDDGKIRTLRFQGALSDFLGWFGFEDAVAAASEVQKGRADFEDVLSAVAKAPVNKVGSGLTPVIKTPMELLAGQSFWPDVFNPRSIRDKKRHVARLFSLEHEYDWLADRPTRGYGASIEQAVVSKRDPEENAYNRIRGIGYEWLRKDRGTEGSSNIQTPRSKALYDWRLAKKFGDRKAEWNARRRMFELDMDEKDLQRSIKRAHPMGMIPLKDRASFKKSLTREERRQLRTAIRWYFDTFTEKGAQ